MKWYTLEERRPKINEWGLFIFSNSDSYPDWAVTYAEQFRNGAIKLFRGSYCCDNEYEINEIRYWIPLDKLEATLPKE